MADTIYRTGELTGVGEYLDNAIDCITKGNYAYAISRTSGALVVIDISNKYSPIRVGELTGFTNPFGVFADPLNDYVYVVDRDADEFAVIDVSTPSAPSKVGQLTGAGEYLDSPQIVRVVGNYAYVTSIVSDSFVIIDISTKSAPVRVGQVVGAVNYIDNPQGLFVSSDGNYAYVTNLDIDTLTIIDCTTKSSPSVIGHYTSGTYIDEARGIDVNGDYAFIVSRSLDMLTIINVSNKTSPSYVSNYTSGTYINYPTDVKVSYDNNYAFVASGTSDSITIIDISDKNNPVFSNWVYGTGDYLDGVQLLYYDYTTNNIYACSGAQDSFAIFKFIAEGLSIIKKESISGGQSLVTGHSRYRWFWFVPSTTENLIRVFNIKDPLNPSLLTSVSCTGVNDVFVNREGTKLYACAKTDNNFCVYDITGTIASGSAPSLLGGHSVGQPDKIVASYDDTYAFISSGNNDTILTFDVSNPASIPASVDTLYHGTNLNSVNKMIYFYDGTYEFIVSAAYTIVSYIEISRSPINLTIISTRAITYGGEIASALDTDGIPTYAHPLLLGSGSSNIYETTVDPEAVGNKLTLPVAHNITYQYSESLCYNWPHIYACSNSGTPDEIFKLLYDNSSLFIEEVMNSSDDSDIGDICATTIIGDVIFAIGEDSDKLLVFQDVSFTYSFPLTIPTLVLSVANDKIVLTWDSVTGAQSYDIYWSDSTGVTKLTGTKITGETSGYEFTVPEYNKDYFFVVVANGIEGYSGDESNEVDGQVGEAVISGEAGDSENIITFTGFANFDYVDLYYGFSSSIDKDNGIKISSITEIYNHTDLTKQNYYYIAYAYKDITEKISNIICLKPVFEGKIFDHTDQIKNSLLYQYTRRE